MWHILISLAIGGICGWLAGMFMGSKNSLLINIILGLIGGVLGNFVFGLIGISFHGIIGNIISGMPLDCNRKIFPEEINGSHRIVTDEMATGLPGAAPFSV